MYTNPISYALNNLKMHIPYEVMEKAFISLNPKIGHVQRSNISVDAIIREMVIEEKVMTDCNLLGGKETFIPLYTLTPERVDHFTLIYRIPKSLTQGRSIVRALSVAYGEGTLMVGTNMGIRNSSGLLDAASGLVSSQAAIPTVASAYVQLIGENVVLINDNMALPANCYLRCRLENDSSMAGLQTTAYFAFAELVVYAVKAYIYNMLRIQMDTAILHAGMELGAFRETVMEYADAAQNYKDYFDTTWKRVNTLNDYQAHMRHCGMIVGGQW